MRKPVLATTETASKTQIFLAQLVVILMNHLGDKGEFLPTPHGFDEFFGNLYHLNAKEEPEDPDYPKNVPEAIWSQRRSSRLG
jgi:arylsulfatase A-like enzyme